MSTEQAYRFFRAVYSDSILQSKLVHALVIQSREVVLQIARECGYPIKAEDIAAALGETKTETDFEGRPDAIAEYVMGRDFWSSFVRSPVWESPRAFNPFKNAPPFRMTIPGPSWVNSPHQRSESRPEVDTRSRPSAVELHEEESQ
ncbi:Nif11-like leader peptide family natural product precursor [Streptomyces cinerochromogenes]|uniref:Nif11-like leader peptide family natural product precursor n=1 Tax=Streptomyces cinerochromogenes TaxID=66422 RepID=UPI0036B0A8E3